MNEQTPADSLSEDQIMDQFLTSGTTESEDQPIDEVTEVGTEEEAEEETEAEETQEGETEAEEETEADPEEETEEAIEYLTEGLVEIDGEAVDIQELKQGHLRQSDYTRKTQEVAEQRKQADQARQAYESQLQALSVAAGTDVNRFSNVNWEQLALQNPEQYRTLNAEYQRALNTQQFLDNQAAEYYANVEQQRKAEQERLSADAAHTLRATIPNWSKEVAAEISQYALTLGYTQDELENIYDPRLVTALYKAQKFDSAKKATKKKIQKSPKKTLSGNKAAPKLANQKHKKAMAKLREKGSEDAAIDAFMTNI